MKIKNTYLASVAFAAAATVSLSAQAQNKEVEMVHWWTSGGEAAALNVLKENMEAQGFTWRDNPIAGGGGTQAMTVLRARVTSGNIPTAVQMLGFDIQDWAALGVLANLNDVAAQENWDAVVPDALQGFSKYEGQWVAAPVNVHSTNWVWASKPVMDQLGVTEPPTTWEGLIEVLDKAKAAGITPIAHGGQAWQDATVFDSVILATGGVEFYQKAMIDLDPDALASDTMKTVFERMETLRGYVDDNFSGRDWNLASAMVIKDEAAIQIMGDWAKGEFLNAGETPNEDFLCFRFPGTQGAVTFNSDQFVLFAVGEDRQEAQNALATATLSPEFQSAFNVVKGSVPARTDVSPDAFDACGQKGMTDLSEANEAGTLLGSMAHGHANTAAVKNAMYDVITRHFNGQLASADAPAALAQAVATAQ